LIASFVIRVLPNNINYTPEWVLHGFKS